MAERRMFSKSIVSSGKFLRMPASARLLYYDLGMAADDDGVVEAYPIMVQTRATEDDLRVLISKGYVTLLNEDLVAYITNWHDNNTIRADRYKPSIYKDLIVQLVPAGIPSGNQVTTKRQPSGNQRYTQVSIGKDSIDKDNIINIDTNNNIDIKRRTSFVPPTVDEVKAYVKEKGYHVDADNFVDFYTSKGWMVGKNKMKDWKAAVRTWNNKDKKNFSVLCTNDRQDQISYNEDEDPFF